MFHEFKGYICKFLAKNESKYLPQPMFYEKKKILKPLHWQRMVLKSIQEKKKKFFFSGSIQNQFLAPQQNNTQLCIYRTGYVAVLILMQLTSV